MPAQPVPLLICAAIETGLNQLIAQSLPEYAKAQLKGKVLSFKLTQLDFPLYFIGASNRMLVLSDYQAKPNVSVKADATTLYQLSEGACLTELIKQDKLSLQGDLATLQAFSYYLQQNPFDYEEFLSGYVGDVASYKLLTGLKQGKNFALKVLDKTRDHISEMATEEYKIALGKLEFLHFKDQLDELVAETKAAERKLQTLMEQC